MKKLFIIPFLTLLSTYAFAQKDAAAKAILDKVSAKYRTYDVVKTDFDRFEWIIAMDDRNIHGLKLLASNPRHVAKIHLMTDFSRLIKATHVPDPYYSGEQGFENVIDLLEDACEGLYQEVCSL